MTSADLPPTAESQGEPPDLFAEAERCEAAEQFDEAVAVYRRAIEAGLRPVDAHGRIAAIQAHRGDMTSAIAELEAAYAADPGNLETLVKLGLVARRLGARQDAYTFFATVLSQMPAHTGALDGALGLLRETGQFDDALGLIDKAIEADPHSQDNWWRRGDLNLQTDDFDAAMEAYDQALQIDPTNPSGYSRFAVAAKELNRPREAIEYCDRSLSLDSGNWRVHVVRGTLLLSLGDLEDGWKEYEWRRKGNPPLDFLQPRWGGQDLTGRTVFVNNESSLADDLMFLSCLQEFAISPARVVLEANPIVLPLIARSFAKVEVHPTRWEGEPGRSERDYGWLGDIGPFDTHTSLGSLPMLLRPTPEAFPGNNDFLVPNPEFGALWADRLAPLASRPKVGLLWADGSVGDPAHARRMQHLFAAAAELPLELIVWRREADQVDFSVLPKELMDRVNIIDGIAPHDIEEISGLLGNLDLYVGQHGHVTNLSAGMGVPTVVLGRVGDWHLLGTERSPWFPRSRVLQRSTADSEAAQAEALRPILASVADGSSR